MNHQNLVKILILCVFISASLQAASERDKEQKYERDVSKKDVHYQTKESKTIQRSNERTSARKNVERKSVEKQRNVTQHVNVHVNERDSKQIRLERERVVKARNVPHYYAMPRAIKPIPQERRWGRVVRYKPDNARAFVFHGIRYYRHNGVFYRPHQGSYIIVRPPIGAIVPVLPLGYALISLYGRDYYFYDQTYYVWSDAPQGYRIVESPSSTQIVPTETSSYAEDNANLANDPYAPGTVFYTLPVGATERILNGVDYYWIDGHYLSKSTKDGRDIYIVVSPR